jgi:hypothetical protein
MKILVRYSNYQMMKYGFVACNSDRFHHVYRDTFGGETLTNIRSAAVSPSLAELCLDMEGSDCNTRAGPLIRAAVSDGKLDVMKWGKESGYELDKMLDKDVVADAALHGHLEVVKYLRKLGISWDESTCSNAAKNGHLELLKWCRANQCPWDEGTCRQAAENGHLELLKWARLNGCPRDENTYESTLYNGDPALARYLEDEGCPMFESDDS